MVAVVHENIRIARLFGSLVKVRARLTITLSRATESLTTAANLSSNGVSVKKLEFHEFFTVPLDVASVKYAPSSTTSSHCFISSTDLFDI